MGEISPEKELPGEVCMPETAEPDLDGEKLTRYSLEGKCIYSFYSLSTLC